MMARQGVFLPALALSILGSLLSCEVAPGREGLLIPVGRLLRSGNSIDVTIDGQPFKPETVPDHSGGYWLRLPFSALRGKSGIQVHFALTSLAVPAHEELATVARWTSPDALIDSDNPVMIAKAARITAGCTGSDAKAQVILAFVQSLGFGASTGMHFKKASETLAEGSGICVNHARLFVALCRAAGIPARTVSGTLSGPDRDGHHEWAEYYDHRKNWHPLDPTENFDFSGNPGEPKHVDLVYDIESNPMYPFARGWEKEEVALKSGDISVFCADWQLQEKGGSMGYRRLDTGNPDSLGLVVEYDLAKFRIN